jgi:hypothetical protein
VCLRASAVSDSDRHLRPCTASSVLLLGSGGACQGQHRVPLQGPAGVMLVVRVVVTAAGVV